MTLNMEKPCTISCSTTSQIRAILTGFLQECDIVYPHDASVDPSYREACYSGAKERGFDLAILGKSLDVGIAIGCTAYRHLPNYSTQIFVGIWSGLAAHIDDSYDIYAEGLRVFVNRFLARERQPFEALDYFATMLREVPRHWEHISSNLIITTWMDFITSTVIESESEGMEICFSKAPGFPQFTRRMTGISRAYSIMTFSPELDFKIWIQVVPDLMHYVDHANDLLSFFKEELDGENINFISMRANSENIPKVEALKKLADETIQGYKRGSRLLQSVPLAWQAYRAFCVGYVEFHALSTRYKLDQLGL